MSQDSQSEPIISVSGLRGIIGTQLTPLVACRYVSAYATTLPAGGKVVIGRDGRQSGSMICEVVSATLAAHGIEPVYLGVASTPTVGVEVRSQGAVGGIQVSASHNPKQYNGLKLFGGEGRVLPAVQGEPILAGYREGKAAWVDVDLLRETSHTADAHAKHHDLILTTVDVDRIREKKFKVLLDSNNGAGSLLGRRLLETLGCDVTVFGETPNGKFTHVPEPTAANLTSVCSMVTEGGFDVGFCQDPDADRLAVIDEQGTYIGEELTLALCLKQVLPTEQGTVVTNCATSSVAKHLANEFGCQVKQSAVGEANVCDLMIAEDAVFGGEGNGGPIDPRVGYVRDSFVGMARILDLMATSGETISQHVASMPPLAIVKDKLEMDTAGLPALFEKLISAMPDAQAGKPDGLKLDWGDRWLLVRGSNTEPIVRFISEAPTTAEAQALCDAGKRLAD
ncbi:MAG: phosphoglucosamine mutase [Planctomycetota bacterium]